MKNKTKKRVGIVAMMLVLILAIGAAAGTTLAKYIYSATVDSQVATVAKWGYTVTANTMELFSDKYDANNIVTGGDALDVKAEAKVVAPGTSNATGVDEDDNATGQMTITINGSAEVAAQLILDITEFNTVWLDQTIASDVTETTAKALGTGKYYPIQWTFAANGKAADLNLEYNEEEEFNVQLAKSLVNAFNYDATVLPTGATVNTKASTDSKVVIDLPAGTTFDNFKLSIAWEWKFESGHDVQDTILGALAGGNTTYLYTSADNGTTITNIDLTKYAKTDYNLGVAFGLHATLVQVQTA